MRFAAKCTAFCCKMRCVLLQNALQQPAIRHHFLVVSDANLGGIFLQREMQKHSKWPKTEGISAQKTLKFLRLGAFYMDFGGYFLLEWFGQ